MKNEVNLVEVMDGIRQRVFDGELDSMKKIQGECVKATKGMGSWELDWMTREMYAAYIIHCSVEGIVPVSGYEI